MCTVTQNIVDCSGTEKMYMVDKHVYSHIAWAGPGRVKRVVSHTLFFVYLCCTYFTLLLHKIIN